MTVFNQSVKNIICFCALECEKQNSGPRSVIWMIQGWDFALNKLNPWRPNDILLLGRMVEPIKNENGIRRVPVTVGETVIPWEHVTRQLVSLCEAQHRLTSEEWYYEFELIHPFIDGNGRVGQIIFNWKKGTLHDPVCAPDFFKKGVISESDRLLGEEIDRIGNEERMIEAEMYELREGLDK